MHIPDGYLSPQTNAVLGVASALAAVGATYKASANVRAKYIPLLSMGAAFSFTVMMFNIPIPDGTTAHATGGALLSILLGPWAAMIGMSIALAIQALFFGDGGVLALGANIFNMGVILPFVSFLVYRLVAGKSDVLSKRRVIAAALAGYIGLNIAALTAAIEFGIQPLLFHTPDGTPLYSPYGLNIAVPAMAFAHLTIAGPVEGLITALVVAYLQRSHSSLLELQSSTQTVSSHHFGKTIITVLVILALLSPLGLLAAGTAWGEWSTEEIQSELGYIPAGMAKFAEFWQHSLFADYAIPGLEQSFWHQALAYILSAFVGFVLIGLTGYILYRTFAKGEDRNESTSLASRR